MTESPGNDILVVALGNYIMGDDAAGLVVGKHLKKIFDDKIDIFEISSAGLELMDVLEGYRKALIIDSIPSNHPGPSRILELGEEDFSRNITCSPHYMGLPETLELAKRLELDFPEEIKMLVLEITEHGVIREGLSAEIEKHIPQFVEKACEILNLWQAEIPTHRDELMQH